MKTKRDYMSDHHPNKEAVLKLVDNGFDVRDMRPERDYYVVRCLDCMEAYSLAASKPVSAGNLLTLLEHAASHK
jgi:hypothetical protein